LHNSRVTGGRSELPTWQPACVHTRTPTYLPAAATFVAARTPTARDLTSRPPCHQHSPRRWPRARTDQRRPRPRRPLHAQRRALRPLPPPFPARALRRCRRQPRRQALQSRSPVRRHHRRHRRHRSPQPSQQLRVPPRCDPCPRPRPQTPAHSTTPRACQQCRPPPHRHLLPCAASRTVPGGSATVASPLPSFSTTATSWWYRCSRAPDAQAFRKQVSRPSSRLATT
jgi:hypothetical protein